MRFLSSFISPSPLGLIAGDGKQKTPHTGGVSDQFEAKNDSIARTNLQAPDRDLFSTTGLRTNS
jgi:hypothetical protein